MNVFEMENLDKHIHDKKLHLLKMNIINILIVK
jgi:hypothetical protein